MKMCPWMSSLWWKWSHANCVYPDECVETDYSSARGGANTQFCQWHLNAQLHFFFFFVVGFLKGKGRKAYNLGNSRSEMEKAVIQTRFGKKGLELWIHSRSSPLPLPVTCFSGRASWTLMTTNIPESPSLATPWTQQTSSLEDTSIFCLETDKKHKRMRHVSVKSAAFASSPVPSIFYYLPARAIRCVVMRRNPAGKFSWLVVIFFYFCF